MFDVILATTSDGGIGLEGNIPWKCKEELQLFKQKTLGHILIVGRKTAQSLPYLKDRLVLVISSGTYIYNNNAITFRHLDEALKYSKLFYPKKTVFVAGGAQLYDYVLTWRRSQISCIHWSQMRKEYICDTFVDVKKLKSFGTLSNNEIYQDFSHSVSLPTQPNFHFNFSVRFIVFQSKIVNGESFQYP